MKNTIKTKIVSYLFDTTDKDQKEQYEALVKTLTERGSKCFEAWGGKGSHYISAFKDGLEIELETNHIFDNQWNTAPIEGISEKGLRVFDWAQDYPINFRRSLKRGHYLEITEEMDNLRKNTLSCGYCGKQSIKTDESPEFCPHCIGSQYLTKDQLYLTRLQLVSDKSDRKKLTDEEMAVLLPKFIHAQTHGNTERDKARIAKQRADIINKRNKTIENANTEHDGLIWLMDNGISIDNVIYYNHTNKFSFGWRTALDAELAAELIKNIADFPFAYEIKCTNGKTLEGIR